VGSFCRESDRTSSASTAAIRKIAAVPSAARVTDHSVAASPTFGDFVASELSRHITACSIADSIPMQQREMTRAVEFLRFTASPEKVSTTHIENFSGAM
jgi:hypothetical protein